MNKEEKIRMEFEKQKFLYQYWSDAEKSELIKLSSIFLPFLLATLVNVSLDFKSWIDYLLILELIVMPVIVIRRVNHYIKKQQKVLEAVEKF